MRKHWEYSEECFRIIKTYVDTYPEVIEMLVYLSARKSKQMNSLEDLYADLDHREAVKRVRQILVWIESLPVSNLPYVEWGFDTLDTNLVN